MVRPSPFLFVGLALLLSGAGSTGSCGDTTIGTACSKDGDCNLKGQRCVPGINGGGKICTKPCTANTGATGCPVGFDCTVTDPNIGLSCNKVSYAVDKMTGKALFLGKNCSIDESVCAGAGAPEGAACRKEADRSKNPVVALKSDPTAFCSGNCLSDLDCPVDMTCGKDWDSVQKCLFRSMCSECRYNDNCPKNFPLCVPNKADAMGVSSGSYCTAACNSNNDCPGSAQLIYYTDCQPGKDSEGTDVRACFHRYGACVGKGELCDPCRVKEDCAKTSSSCVVNQQSFEGFCTKQCDADTDCNSPNPISCDSEDQRYSHYYCTGDKTHFYPGLATCWGVPQ